LENTQSYYQEELVKRFAEGDEDAFTKIYDRFYFRIYQYACRWLVNTSEAEDVTVETFIKLLRRKESFVDMRNIEAFLRVSVRNACLDQLKYRKVRTDHHEALVRQLSLEEQTDFEWVEVQEVFLSLVYAEIDRLPSKMREVLLLSYRDGLKPREVAKRLGLKVRTVSNQKTNAIHLLRAALAQHSFLLALLVICWSTPVRF